MKRTLPPTAAEERAFLHSVLYASVFDYPLTVEQLHESLIGVEADPSALAAWYANSDRLQDAIEHRNGYFFPRGRGGLIEVRHARERSSRAVLRNLQRPLALVLRMPFVRMVALSGSLAHLNADGRADLDLFVITTADRVWGVTTTVIVLSRLFGWRERLCLNYVISERHLDVEPRDLFAANQIIHLRPLTGVAVYDAFVTANTFVTGYYPNFRPRRAEAAVTRNRTVAVIEWLLDRTVASLYERCCRVAYRWYLQRRAASWQSRDQVRLETECLKLHTSSHRHSVMARFEAAVADAERSRPAAAVHAQAGR